jgi:hypothetical protein
MLNATRELTGDQEWAPDEVIEHIDENGGVRADSLDVITRNAPGTIAHEDSNVTVYRSGNIRIESEHGSLKLNARDELIISYELGDGRLHAECISAEDFQSYADVYKMRAIITQK